MVKIIGSCAPSVACASTSTQTARRALASGSVEMVTSIMVWNTSGIAGSRKLEIAPVSMAIVVIGTEVVRMDWRIVETEQDLLEGQVFLAACEPRFASALQLIGVLPLRRKPAVRDAA